eukprot:1142706-Pelagomonas_calceolata.AAC.5
MMRRKSWVPELADTPSLHLCKHGCGQNAAAAPTNISVCRHGTKQLQGKKFQVKVACKANHYARRNRLRMCADFITATLVPERVCLKECACLLPSWCCKLLADWGRSCAAIRMQNKGNAISKPLSSKHRQRRVVAGVIRSGSHDKRHLSTYAAEDAAVLQACLQGGHHALRGAVKVGGKPRQTCAQVCVTSGVNSSQQQCPFTQESKSEASRARAAPRCV